jgi:RNA polymerase sigma factor (sigma-70 family)
MQVLRGAFHLQGQRSKRNSMATTAIHATGNIGEGELLACVPHLRAFAWFLARNRERADDLVQDTIVRALGAAHRFQAGTNLKAWMFTILRNLHYNEVRKNRVQVQSLDDPLAYEPAVLPAQMASLEFGDFRRAFWQLADDQRSADPGGGERPVLRGSGEGVRMPERHNQEPGIARSPRAAADSGGRPADRQAAGLAGDGRLRRWSAGQQASGGIKRAGLARGVRTGISRQTQLDLGRQFRNPNHR